MPADAVKFWRWRVDGQQSWATLQKMLGHISPMALASLNSFIDIANSSAQQKDPNFDVRKNLIANLGDDCISYQKKPAGTTLADLNQAPSIFMFAAPHPDQAALALKSVMGMVHPRILRRRHGISWAGKFIPFPCFPPGRRWDGPAAPAPRSLYCTASGGYVALSGDTSMIEDYLRSDPSHVKPLRRNRRTG